MKTNEKIRLLRISKGFSQEWVAQKLKISQDQFSKMERGKKEISEEDEARIIEVLGESNLNKIEQGLKEKPRLSIVHLLYELQNESGNNMDYQLLEKFIRQREKMIDLYASEVEVLKKIMQNRSQLND